MSNRPLVVVEAPDERGLRVVRVRGEVVGRAWSRRDLKRLVRRAGLTDLDLDDAGRVHWLADPAQWPDHAWRRRAAGALAALGLLASATVLFYVGTQDAFNALAYGGRVVGAGFVAAALAEVAAALAVLDFWGKRRVRYSGAVVLTGVATVAATNLMFLITQLQGWSYTPFLWLWLGLALWVAWSVWMLTRQHAWQGLPRPKRVALGVVASGLAGIAGIVYSQMYVPYSTPVNIQFRVSFGDPTLSADGALLHVPAHVEFRNTGSVRVYVIGTLWKSRGWPTKFTEKGTEPGVWKREMFDYDETLRHVVYSPARMMGAGDFGSLGDRLDPGQDLSTEYTVDVPLRTGLGRIELDAYASYVRADRAKLGNESWRDASWDTTSSSQRHEWDAPAWVSGKGEDFIHSYSRIYHSSEMLNLTHATDYAASWVTFPNWQKGVDFPQGDTDPDLKVAISRDPDGVETLSDSEQEPYGMATTQVWAERSVDQLLKAAKR
ncbi:hypothetical protein [Streptomyces alanosinicus]|uniref:Uncharacterized protein n=1 Tax=Streptomyces alanosinicus TaxID=68171 RepID=A0A918INY0_9ACTN|nr:hypothetical protein [Streptomyces alanosinicus]GGW24549.1 hypothetical protein GCM10010339_94330 [Streptomyces alanosinicus]